MLEIPHVLVSLSLSLSHGTIYSMTRTVEPYIPPPPRPLPLVLCTKSSIIKECFCVLALSLSASLHPQRLSYPLPSSD